LNDLFGRYPEKEDILLYISDEHLEVKDGKNKYLRVCCCELN